MKRKRAETKRRHKKMLDQATYLRQQYERAKREKRGIKGKLKSVTEEIKELKIENDDLKLQQTENRSVSTLSNGRYNDDIRTCVMELQSLEIPSNKVSEVIKSVSENICKMKGEKLPKRTTVQNIIDEGHCLVASVDIMIIARQCLVFKCLGSKSTDEIKYTNMHRMHQS